MNCESKKCKNTMTTPHPCTKCLKKFCAKACKIDHFFEAHLNDTSQFLQNDPIPIKRKNSIQSIFLKPGKYLKEFVPHPDYNYSNFEKIRSGTGKNSYYIIGSGGFGEVFLCKHKEKKFYVAIKEMNKKRILDAGHKLDLIYKEINYTGRLIHENIVKLYSFWEDDKNIYLIMEYADSGNLFGAIRKNSGFAESEAFEYFVQICSAVNFIHENNLIHRDLKPENILIAENNKLKLCDFGWCVELNVGNRSTFCGTYEYMAPEIIREKPYDHGIDVWSLGVLLYELLHGYSPFKAEVNYNDCYEVFENIVKYNLKFDKDISDDCKDLIIKLLSPDLKSRIKVKEIFDHPWFRHFENIELEKSSKINKTNLENKKISEVDNKSIVKNETNKIKISKKEEFTNILSIKNSSGNNLIEIDDTINQEGNPNPIDSYKSSIGFEYKTEKKNHKITISANAKNKLNLKDLKKEHIENIIDNKQIFANIKNETESSKKFIYDHVSVANNFKDHDSSNNLKLNSGKFNNEETKKFETIDNEKEAIQENSKIVKKKKKILIAKTPTYNENILNNNFKNKVLQTDNKFIENYKEAKIAALKNRKLSKASTIKEQSNTIDSIGPLKTELNKISDKEIYKNMEIKNPLDPRNNILRENEKALFESKTAKNSDNKMNLVSANMKNKKNTNKISNKTASDILRDLSPRQYENENIVKENYNNFNNLNQNYENFNKDKIENSIDFKDNGYDLENFIIMQNSKKTKNINNMKSPYFKDKKFIEKFTNNTKKENDYNANKFTNYDSEEEFQNNFGKLMYCNNPVKNKIDKSMDKSFNEISRDHIKEKINSNKNKSIMNALNKTQNDIEKYDNNQMNSSVIDVVFSKIEGKNKNKHKNKDNDSKKKNVNDNVDVLNDKERNLYNLEEFTIKNFIKDDDEKDKNDFRLFAAETEGNEQDQDFYVTRKAKGLNLADLQIDRKYETTREYEMENFEFNNISKNNKPLNKIYKRGEKEGLKISLSNNTKENYDDRYTSNQIDKEDVFNVIPRNSPRDNYKKHKTNEQEVQNLIKNFQGNPSFGNLKEESSNTIHKQKMDLQTKKSVLNNNNNKEDIMIMNSQHSRTKSNNYMATPNPFDDEYDSNNMDKAKSKSKDKNLKLPKEKKNISSNSNRFNNNNNELIYSKEFNRESNYNKNNKKAHREKNKLQSMSRDYGFEKFNENQCELHSAMELLEQANQSKNDQLGKENKDDNLSKWDKFINFINPFKCG